ncbi:MAG: thioredoxin family protein [Dehalococcoidia bacterium]|nr:thioredoxin family protein [Dehalococcoidia bacterium]
MSHNTSVVTKERFNQGIASFNEWLEKIDNRQKQFKMHYDEYTPEKNDLQELQAIVSEFNIKALLLGESWCPDVWRGLPVLAKLAEETGMEVKYFLKDENQDIMSEFLKDGEFESIPTIIFYDKNLNYLFHWIERPQQANEEMAFMRDKFLSNVPAEGEEKDEAMKAYRREIATKAEEWRHLTLKEIVTNLKNSLN